MADQDVSMIPVGDDGTPLGPETRQGASSRHCIDPERSGLTGPLGLSAPMDAPYRAQGIIVDRRPGETLSVAWQMTGLGETPAGRGDNQRKGETPASVVVPVRPLVDPPVAGVGVVPRRRLHFTIPGRAQSVPIIDSDPRPRSHGPGDDDLHGEVRALRRALGENNIFHENQFYQLRAEGQAHLEAQIAEFRQVATAYESHVDSQFREQRQEHISALEAKEAHMNF